MPTALALVETRGQSALTTSLIVAEGCKLSHQSVLRLVKKYQDDFAELGEVGFEIRLNPQGTPTEFAILNEDQATYLITLFRNNPIVRRFKLNLVKAFRRALTEIARLYANPPRADILKAKRESNHFLNDSLKEAREEEGKDTKAYHYANEAKLCNWAVTGRFEPINEKTLSNEDAALLERVRDRNTAYIKSGLSYDVRKAKLSAFAVRARTRLLERK